jgi:crotonobetainyl-CoA:carnitine CoA-transferase CaiB-like acyl-CoA transferase
VAGLDPAGPSLSWAPASAIVLCLTPFGLTGPFAGWRMTPFTSFAVSGLMHRMGEAGRPPAAIPGRQAWDQAAVHGVVGVLAALRVRESGGQFVDVAVHDVLSAQDEVVQRYSVASVVQQRGEGAGYPPNGPWSCADGTIEFQVHTDRHWAGFVEMLDRPAELTDPSLAQRLARTQRADELRPAIAALLAPRSRYELIDRGQALGVPCGLLNTPRQFTDDPQLQARGFVVDVPHPTLGSIRVPGAPFRSTPPLLRRRDTPAAPETGSAWPTADAAPPAPDGAPRAGDRSRDNRSEPGPLAGLRVLSLGNFIAGNSYAMTMAELGADVVKVESHHRPDPVRARFTADHEETREPSGPETTTLFAGLSRSVRDLSIDLKAPGAAELFRRLARAADVVFENFGSGVVSGLGLGPEDLSTVNPELVMVSVSGYGRTGPRAHYLAYGGNISSFTGLTHLWGHPHGAVYDYVAGTHAVAATLAALESRDRTGAGRYIDVAQTEAAGAVLGPLLLGHLNGGDEAVPGAASGSWLSAVVRTRGADDWLAVDVRHAADWSALATVLGPGAPPLSGALPTAAEVAALTGCLEAWAATRTPLGGAATLQRAGIPAAPVSDSEDVWRDPQLRARGAIVGVDHPDLGRYDYPAPAIRLSRTPMRIRRPSPRLGQDTRYVLTRWLGASHAEIDELVAAGVVATDAPTAAGR